MFRLIVKLIMSLFYFFVGYSTNNFLESKKNISNNKRYIVFKNDDLFSENRNISIMSSLSEKKSNIKKIEGLNAYSIKSDKDLEKNKIKGFTVYKERVYKTNFLTSCERNPIYENPKVIEGEELETWGIKAVSADSLTVDASKIKVCIVDTGIDKDHSEFKNLKIQGKSFVENRSSFQDDMGHGTHVAGIISAAKDKKGMFGVSNASLIIAKSLDSGGSGLSSWIASGVMYCIKKNADIINMSLGAPASWGVDPLISKAVEKAASKGIKVFMATGNDSGRVGSPAMVSWSSENLFAVSASTKENNIASFSSRGKEVSLIAPGEAILSTKLGGGYVVMDGTSMATPFASGVAALYEAKKRKIKYKDIGLKKTEQGLGLIDASDLKN